MTTRDRSAKRIFTRHHGLRSGVALLLFASFGVGYVLCASAAGKLVWKPIDQAILRVDDQPPKDWNIYRGDKKGDVLLLKLGPRYLLLDTKKQEVREIAPDSVTPVKDGMTNAGGENDGKPLASNAWNVKDVGGARRIVFKLAADNKSFTIELPHWVNRAVTY